MTYALLDSGDQKKLERFGEHVLVRPAAQALWRPKSAEWWQQASQHFSREEGGRWRGPCALPSSWEVALGGLTFRVSPTDFGHLGLFPEHQLVWDWATARLREGCRVLNAFAYSGGATMALAKAGAQVTHLDASKGMVHWARENAQRNGLAEAPIRWIVDDAMKFMKRELKRGVRYDAIILDPPSFGRGRQGEVFKVEQDILSLLELATPLLSEAPLFLIFTSHTLGMTPLVLHNLLSGVFQGGIAAQELVLRAEKGCDLPCGSAAIWAPS